jgi:hypothetical protein
MPNMPVSKIVPHGTFLTQDAKCADVLGGGHTRIALSMAEAIRETISPGPIALLGPLGSGKSTVIALLTNTLSLDSEDCNFTFTFDTWSHGKDPLRSSFLEELIMKLVEKRWLCDGDAWRQSAALISGRLSKSEGIKTNYLTPSAVYLGLAAVFVSLLMTAFINFYLKDSFGFDKLHTLVVGNPFAVVEVLLFLALSTYWIVLDLSSTPSYIRNLARSEHSETEIRNTGDTSSSEFKKHFLKVVEEALGASEKRRLIIVLDNIDRSGDVDIGKLWSIVETFFDGSVRDSWFQRLWLIVPISGENAESKTEALSSRNKIDKELMTKMFAVQYRMPAMTPHPVTNFLQDQLKIAFANIEIITVSHIWATVQIYRIVKGLTYSSPREIKHFVNALVALSSEWQHQLQLPVVAVYVLYHDVFIADLAKTLSGANFHATVKQLLAEYSWEEQLLQLHFHLEADQAKHALIEEQMNAAIANGTIDGLEKFLALPGFSTVVQHSFANLLNELYGSAHAMSRCAAVLDRLDQSHSTEYAQLWQMLSEMLTNHTNWYALNAESGEGLAIIIRRQPPAELEQFGKKILLNLSNPLSDPPASYYCSGLVRILQTMIDLGLQSLIAEQFQFPSKINMISGLLQSVRENAIPVELMPYFKPATGKVTESFCTFEIDGNFSKYLRTAFDLWPEENWSEVCHSILTRIMNMSAQSNALAICNGLSSILWLADKKGSGKNALNELARSGNLFVWLGTNTDKSLRAASMATIIFLDPTGVYGEEAPLRRDFATIRDRGLNICEQLSDIPDETVTSDILLFLSQSDLMDVDLPEAEHPLTAGMIMALATKKLAVLEEK